ncbi:c-type cytochrome [Alphaproteobacteria bacterium KMM 3653]|uniref:C-type cytochrome n=1 Tax=Harenicola maris TaxID=2841044 RepID=A0AAP2G854_9RHOB|nr:c-type cytochrome [Harenicola maris]
MKFYAAMTTAALLATFAPAAMAESHETESEAEGVVETAAPAAPSGDIAAGEAAFAKQCVTCHVVQNAEGETLAGKRSRTGPNLYAIALQPAGAVEGFRYGKSMIEAGETSGLTWTEENFAGYVMDPTNFLREFTGDKRARAKMSFKVKQEQDAKDIYAFLYSLAPPAAE